MAAALPENLPTPTEELAALVTPPEVDDEQQPDGSRWREVVRRAFCCETPKTALFKVCSATSVSFFLALLFIAAVVYTQGFDMNDGMYGHGVYLSADDSPFQSVQLADVDEDGLRHVVLCRVLLGKTEAVHPYSDQAHPTSEEFYSGVDNLQSLKKYIVWSTNMNTHILSEYVVSFRAPLNLRNVDGEDVKKPSSPWMPFPDLIHELAKFLPLQSVVVIYKHYRSQRQKKVSRIQLIQFVRQVAGDELLMEVIKSWKSKIPRALLKRD